MDTRQEHYRRLLLFENLFGGKNKFKGPLFHYTSRQGLTGILRSDSLIFWFSAANKLNDMEEGEEIYSIVYAVGNKLLNEHNISEDFFNCLLNCWILSKVVAPFSYYTAVSYTHLPWPASGTASGKSPPGPCPPPSPSSRR